MTKITPAKITPAKTGPVKTPRKPKSGKGLKLTATAVADIFAPQVEAAAPQLEIDGQPTFDPIFDAAPAPAAPAKPEIPAPEVMIKAVRDYALEYYNEGWDIVIESWEDEDIAKTIVGAKSEKGAIRKVWHVVKELIDYRKEVQAA